MFTDADTETVTVLDGDLETYTDPALGVVRARPGDSASVAGVDIQPGGGSGRLVPEGFRAECTYTGFVELDDATAATLRALFKAGRRVQRANGAILTILHVADWGQHLVLAFKG